MTSRATSGAGTSSRRSDLGSDRIISVTSSSRSPGICQSNSAGLTWLSRLQRDVHGHAVGVAAGLEGVGQGQGAEPRGLRGPDVRVGVLGDLRGVVGEQITAVNVSRSGSVRRARFHQVSKCWAETTSAGMRAS